MGRLIIAEKHSVAQAIAAALGGGKAEDGWIGCGADAVTWAQGHLVDLLTPDEYQDRGWDKWSMDALPLDPTGGWKWKVNRQRGADRQYRVVAGLLKSDEYDVLVNACDPDREGESIFHRIVSHAGTRKPMLRLWVASLEEDAIRDALDSMRSEDEYRGLAEAADIRAQLRELDDFIAKLDTLLASDYDPKLDDGVGKNIAPLQQAGLLSYAVLKETGGAKSQLNKFLNANW